MLDVIPLESGLVPAHIGLRAKSVTLEVTWGIRFASAEKVNTFLGGYHVVTLTP